MLRYSRPARLFAASLSALAGFVDAAGFLHLGGFFVSFMSGNSTRLAVAAASGAPLTAGVLIAAFVCGVTLGALAARRAPAAHRGAIVLTLVAVLLAAAAVLGAMGMALPAGVAMALAMGAENGVFATEDEVHIGVTYMTGTLVKLGQRLAGALAGGDRLAFLPYLGLWLGLVAGAVAGASAYGAMGAGCFWIAAMAAGGLAVIAWRMGELRPSEGA
jgi:uncharacterized membrane protein YoaK (UPF0700 family)